MRGFNDVGFVTEWLVTDVAEAPFDVREGRPEGMDQLAYEARLRGGFVSRTAVDIAGFPSADDEGYWRYWYRHGACFVDFSKFYSSLTDISFFLRAKLCAEAAASMDAFLWTYAAVDVLVNGALVAASPVPVYKPIGRTPFRLDLCAGANDLVLRVRNLGVRDTRNIAGIQIRDPARIVSAAAGERRDAMRAGRLLESLSCRDGALRLSGKETFSGFPGSVCVTADGVAIPIGMGAGVALPTGCRRATVECRVGGDVLRRTFELADNIHPFRPETPADLAAHRRAFIARIARREREPRGSGVFFSVFHVLARLAGDEGTLRSEDRAYLMEDLRFITERVDCADFLVIGFIRLLAEHRPFLDDELLSAIRATLLGFRYWMDENGSDGMCFWSENHAIMFHGSQAAVGALYPNDLFTRSGRTGREQAEAGSARCRAWIADAEREGFEEFNSASYTPVTVAALLNLVDFASEDISQRASALIDGLLRRLARHVFKGSAIGPQGRVYRDAIYPFEQSVQALLHYIDPSLPCSTTETMWNVCFATTSYRFPEDLRSIMDAPYSGDYVSGNARIVLEKTSDYLLACVRSPRSAGDEPVWTNLCFADGADRSANAYVKSLNERFHGTTVFRPGVYGYQQHLWYAALDNEAVVFSTHPGSAVDLDGMRPGYWYGNGVMPAVDQRGPALAAVYDIPEEHPIGFTHVFWPASKFRETAVDGAWRFARTGDGYLGLWCSSPLVPYDDVLPLCELRCGARSVAYACLLGDRESDASFAIFRARCAASAPSFDTATKTIHWGSLVVRYVRHVDVTQVI